MDPITSNVSLFDLNKLTLNFNNKATEREFRKEYFQKSLPVFRLSFITVTILYAAFGLLDYATTEVFYKSFYMVRYFIVLPVLLATFFFSFHRHFEKYWQFLLSVCFVISGSGILYMLLINPENIYYYGGMFLVFMAGYFFIKLRFFPAIIPGAILIIIYNIAALVLYKLNHAEYYHIVAANAFYISANIIGVIALYNIERLERVEFYQKAILFKKQLEISDINKNLEAQVEERTKLLDDRNVKLMAEIESRKKIGTELIKSKEKAEESDRLKSTFLATMSHELRTPLNAIIGFSDLMSSDFELDEILGFAKTINTNGNHLLSIVNDLMDISLIESGQMVIIEKTVNLKSFFADLSEVVNYEAQNAKKEHVALKFVSPSLDDDIILKTDSSKLKQVLLNLIKNALKFTHFGAIVYGFEFYKIDRKEFVKFFVKDSGIGIPKNKQDLIFDIFRQVEDCNTREYGGTGIGLSISKKITNKLGGEIWLESEVGVGSTFYFTIPRNPQNSPDIKSEQDIDKKPLLNKKRKKTVLVVEDVESSFEYLQVLLKRWGLHTIWARNGEISIDIIKEKPEIDLVLMDINMPGINGLDATAEIKKINPLVPVIAQTAYAISGDREKCLEAGCDDYLSKPIKQELLKSKIQKYLGLN